MEAIIIFLLIGVGAQLVKGSMGMAYGVTSTTLLVFTGVQAAAASAIVHLVEVGTTLALGLSHWKMGNVDWKLALSLSAPGAFGAFIGARVLGQASASAARPLTAAILVALGTFIVLRFIGLVTIQAKTVWGPKRLGVLGLVVGGLDATGGGGWGTMTTSTLMAAGKREPRRIVGTVLAAQFLVATAATLGFIPVLSREVEHHAAPALGLFIGGTITAPFAAWLAGKSQCVGSRWRGRRTARWAECQGFIRRTRRQSRISVGSGRPGCWFWDDCRQLGSAIRPVPRGKAQVRPAFDV